MSIRASHLTKVYGQQKAVNDISFTVKPGEIVGFLGPNGAGKSTTMKIMTGYLPPTSGLVQVADRDITEEPLNIRQLIGYLPEHNPLYLDMYVREFLRFVGRVYGLKGKALTRRVEEIVGLCGLTKEQNKKIEALSKGYRQRVGLAQALIHDPQVLILDEPTTGLDPNQIIEIRQLIKTISKNKTVIFSTHIMQEVQAICNRVLVINKGEIVADDMLENLLNNKSGNIAFIADFDQPVSVAELQMIPGVDGVEEVSSNSFRILSNKGADLRPEIFRFAADRKLSLLGLKQDVGSLETIFKELTQANS